MGCTTDEATTRRSFLVLRKHESGDPTFYDRQGNLVLGRACGPPILILGFVETKILIPFAKPCCSYNRR